MIISRQLLHKAQNRLQVILSLVEEAKNHAAVERIRELAVLLSSHVESPADEQARLARENDET